MRDLIKISTIGHLLSGTDRIRLDAFYFSLFMV